MDKSSKIKLSDGNEIPIVGLGTWQLTGEDCTKTVSKALNLGYIHLDTAEAYKNESEIAPAIKNFPRENIFITSKVWPDNLDYEKTITACNDSLSRLKIDYLDLYLIHWPWMNPNLEEVFNAFKTLQDEGKIKSIGISNFTISEVDRALKIAEKIGIKITINQVEFHPKLYQKELLDHCESSGVKLTAYSPLARGNIRKNEIIKEVAKKHNKTPEQISLRWIIQKGIIAIPKSSSEEHLKSNINIFDFELDQEDLEKLDNLPQERQVNPSFAHFDD